MNNKFLVLIFVSLFLLLSGCASNDDSSETSYVGGTTSASETITNSSVDVNSEDSSSQTDDNEIVDTPKQDFSDISVYDGELDESITKIATAYLENNPRQLTDKKEIATYKECKRIIDMLISDEMTDYEKELAIHDYIVTSAQYDLDELSTFKTVSEDSLTPYGLLIKGKGICLAYTRTFQLFMDMLEIDCITVHSTAYGIEEHAWNMVRLDGYWYHVDVTWDDPIPNKDFPTYTYFNVTDEIMEKQHQWNKSNFPVAESETHSYTAMSIGNE